MDFKLCLSKPSGVELSYGVAAVSRRNSFDKLTCYRGKLGKKGFHIQH